VDEHLLVLLIPVIEPLPVQGDVTGDARRRRYGRLVAQTASAASVSPTRTDQYVASPLCGQCVLVSERSNTLKSTPPTGK
jgi:hypothetical protein